MCDRKFFVKQIVNANLLVIEANEVSMTSFSKSLADHRAEMRDDDAVEKEKLQAKINQIDEVTKEITEWQEANTKSTNLL